MGLRFGCLRSRRRSKGEGVCELGLVAMSFIVIILDLCNVPF